MFGSVLAVADEKGGVYRYLDLMTKQVQDEIENFTGKKILYMKLLFKSVIKMITESQMQTSIVTNIIV